MASKKEARSRFHYKKRVLEKYENIMLDSSHIPLWLDEYQDIFSDFDPRPFSQKALSDDFLQELKRASRDKFTKSIELKLMIPAKKMEKKDENLIKKRLRNHFNKHYTMINSEMRSIITQGFLFFIFGIIAMFAGAYITYKFDKPNLFKSFLIIFFEPGGWFLFWKGLELILFESKTKIQEVEFYKKMSNCRIDFLPY